MKRLVLFSGGLKSTFLAALAAREGESVLCYFMFNQKDRDRALAVDAFARRFSDNPLIMYDLVKAPPLEETLLRMLYLVLHVLPIAKAKQCKCIYHGLSQDDDPRIVSVVDAYVKQLGALIELAQPLYNGKGIWLGQIAVETPLRRLDRARVIRLGNEWNIPWELTLSCSDPHASALHCGTIHCGACNNCDRRKRAFKREGHDDPTIYEVR